MTELARLKFYATQPHPCSYLPEEQATTLFLDPSQPMDTQLYASLSEVGFRRSGDHLYRPHCQHCTACIAARIPVADFSPNRQQRRILKRNAELQVIRKRPSFNEEYYDLYRRYIEQRHADGDMYPPSRDQFATFLVRDLPFCCFFEFRLHGRLLAIAVTDVLPNGLSAVYTFYDPDEEQRSLGRYAILWQIAETERLGLQAVYLGYWIKNCRKMNYKTQYRPIELGPVVDGLRVINGGLQAGEKIIIKGLVRPGMAVTPRMVPMQAPAAPAAGATGATKAAANAPAPAAAPAKAGGADPAKADGAAGSAEARK